MKKKWINLKRRWRKMHKSDRMHFACMGTLTALNIATLPWAHGNVMNILWLALLLWMRWMYVAALRKDSYYYFHRGALHQWWSDDKRRVQVLEQCFQAERAYADLNSKYKKLEYDYRQLKKQVKKQPQTK